MHPNPLLKKLGFSNTDRLAIIHCDDLGMCQASLTAFADLWDFGLISSGATMVPCAWFPALAAYCRSHPGVDMGVHITLTSEWDTYRWAPLSTHDSASGLIDEEGYFYRSEVTAQQRGDPSAAQVEMQAQLARALAAGIDVTHIDTHMGTVAHPKFIPAYTQLGIENRLPAMILRLDEAGYRAMDMDAETAAFAAQAVFQLEEMGVPLLDNLFGMPLDQPENQLEFAKKGFADLPIGITHFILHPSTDTPELRAVAPDWPSRVANYHTFLSEELRQFIKNIGVHVIGYRALCNVMRAARLRL